MPTGAADVVVDFGASRVVDAVGGRHLASRIHSFNPVATVTGDLDGNGHDDLVINFGPGIGVWTWMNHATWRVHPSR